MNNLILIAAGIVVGAFVTSAVAEVYYEQATKNLIKEAEKLRKFNILMLRAMEQAGLAEFSRDDDGDINEMVIKLKSPAEIEPQTPDDVKA